MSTLAQSGEHSLDGGTTAKPKNEAQIAARKRRAEALKRVTGIWAHRDDIPADSLKYQRDLRAEWHS